MEFVDKILSILIVYQSLVFSLLFVFFFSKTKNEPFKPLSIFMLLNFLYFGFSLSYYYANYKILTLTYYLSLPVALSLLPVFYIYIQSLTQRKFRISQKDFIHFIPSLVVLLLNFPYLLLSYNEKLWFVSGGYGQITDNMLLIYLKWINRIGVFGFINLQLIVYLTLSVYFYKRYKMEIEEIFSYKENIDLKWIKVLVICFFIFFLMIDFVHFLNVKTNQPHRILFNTSMLVFNFVIFAYGLYQKNIFIKPSLSDNTGFSFNEINKLKNEKKSSETFDEKINEEIEEELTSKYQKSTLSDRVKNKIISDLEKYMTKKPYCYCNLTIDDVAEALNTNTKYLSQVINETYQKNFYTYINSFRINDSKEMLINPEYSNYSTEGIAKSVGFNSKSSFYSAFKKYTGQTPVEFKKIFKKDLSI